MLRALKFSVSLLSGACSALAQLLAGMLSSGLLGYCAVFQGAVDTRTDGRLYHGTDSYGESLMT